MKKQKVVIEKIFNVSKKLVWQAVTDKEMMKQWYFDLKTFKAVVGFKFEFLAGVEPGKPWKHLCEIAKVIPESKLTYLWRYEGYNGMSFVIFELFDNNGSTRLNLTHSGIDTFPADVPDFAVSNFEKGWNKIINHSLKNFLEEHRN